MDKSWVPDPARYSTRSLASGNLKHRCRWYPGRDWSVVSLRAVVGAEALGRLHLTELPPPLARLVRPTGICPLPSRSWSTAPAGFGDGKHIP
eukprot:3417861-Pyramimonas_sp.AAC.1